MKLSEFERGSKITISSVKSQKHYEFETEIIGIKEGMTVAKPVIVNGRMIRLSDSDITNAVTVNAGSKVYAYRNVKIVEAKISPKGKQFVICIDSNEDVEAENRRDFFRVYLGVEGTMQKSAARKAQEVVIKDISANGVGVICPKTPRLSVGTNVFVTFVDELTSEEFQLECKIVRCVKHNEEMVLYGCQLPEENDAMEKLVALKQRIH